MSAPVEFVQLLQTQSQSKEEKEEILYSQQRCEPTEIASTPRLPTTSTAFREELGRRIGSKIPDSQTSVLQFLADTLHVAEIEGYELKLDEPCPYSPVEADFNLVETILIRILNYLYLYHPSEEEADQVRDEKNVLMILHGLTVQIGGVCGYDWSQPIIAEGRRSVLHACVGLNFDWFLHSRTSIIEAMAKLMDALLAQLKQRHLSNSNNIRTLSSIMDFRMDYQPTGPTPLLVAFWSKVGREMMPIIRILRKYGASLERAESNEQNLFWYKLWHSIRTDMNQKRLELLLTWILSEPNLSNIILSLKDQLLSSTVYSAGVVNPTSKLEFRYFSSNFASPTFEANKQSHFSRIYHELLDHLCQLGYLQEELDRTMIAWRGVRLESDKEVVLSKEATIRSWCQTQLVELEADTKTHRYLTAMMYQRLTSNGYSQRGEFDLYYNRPLIHAAVSDALAWWPQKLANSFLAIPIRLWYSDLGQEYGGISNHPNLLQVLLALPPSELCRFEAVQDTLFPLMERSLEARYFGLSNLSKVGLSSIRLIIRGSHRPRHRFDFTWRLYDIILRKMTQFYEDRLPAQETELCFQAFVQELEEAAANPSITDQRACVNGIMLLIELFRSHGIDAVDPRPNRPGSDEDFYSLICVNPKIMTMWLQLHRPNSSATSATSINQSNDLNTHTSTLIALSSIDAVGSTLPTTTSSPSSSIVVPLSAPIASTTSSTVAWPRHLVYDFSPHYAIWPKRFGSRRLAEESLLDTILRLRTSSNTTASAPVVARAKAIESVDHELVVRRMQDEFDQYYAPIFRTALNHHLIPDLANLTLKYLSG